MATYKVDKLPQYDDTEPMIEQQKVESTADGFDAFAKVLGGIAQDSAIKAEDYAEEASHTQMLQQQSMLSDLESNSKIQMYQNPGQATQISEKAAYTADTIKQTASLNRKDRENFNYLTDNTVRDIKLAGAKQSIDLTRETAKYATLSAFDNTKQQIYEKLFTDPKAADILLNAQYSSLAGQVNSGILTATEASTLHNQLNEEILRAQMRGSTYKSGEGNAAHVNALNSYQSAPTPYSNVDMPMTESTMQLGESYVNHMSAQDLKAQVAAGHALPATAMMYIKSDESAMSLQSYKFGAAQANGKILSGRPWQEIKQDADFLNTNRVKLTDEQEGYRDRLNNFVLGIEKGGKYAEYVASTPAGARAYTDFNRKRAAIDNTVFTGLEGSPDQQKQLAQIKNLNDLWSNLNAVGIGMDIPDQYRNTIQEQYTAPIKGSFAQGANPSSAINMISVFDKRNLAYAANAMPKATQQLTVYETGQMLGKADAGFLTSFWKSQQDGIDYTNLQTDKTGMSDKKIIDMVNPALTNINDYLRRLPNGVNLASASTEKALRYIKYQALVNNDPTFSRKDDYIKEYADNVGRAYQPLSSYNYMIDQNVIPLQKPQADTLAAHALNMAYKQMQTYMNESEFKESISRNPPFVISTPTGRLTVVDQYGRAVGDKNGHAAFDEFYTEGLMRQAENDPEVQNILEQNNMFMYRPGKQPFKVGI